MDLGCARCVAKYFKINQIPCCKFETNISISCLWFLWWCMCKVFKISARFFKFQDNMPKCTRVILSHDEVLQKPFLESSPWLQSRCHLRWGRKCTSWVFQIDAILKKALPRPTLTENWMFASSHGYHFNNNYGFVGITSPFSRTVPTTVIRLTFHENVEKVGDVDCWVVDSQLNRLGAHSKQQPDQTHTDWGWALSYRGSSPQKIPLEYQKYSRITENIIIGPSSRGSLPELLELQSIRINNNY